jgi:hypothetical protein
MPVSDGVLMFFHVCSCCTAGFNDLFGAVYDPSLAEQRISPGCFVFGSDCVLHCWMDYAWALLVVSTEI